MPRPTPMLLRRRTHRRVGGRSVPAVPAALVALGALTAAACGDEPEETPAELPRGTVVAGTPEAAEAGLSVLEAGGNAVDAAVAVSLALGVTEPGQSGLGGRVVALVVPAGGEPVVLHVPSSALPTPGAPAALPVLGAAFERYGSGRVEWADVVEPAVRLAETGWRIGTFRHRGLVRAYDQLRADSGAAAVFIRPDGGLKAEGTVVADSVLARTLRAVAEEGPGALAVAARAETLAEAFRTLGSEVSPAALARTPGVRADPPLSFGYRGRTVLAPPAPYGGPVLRRALSFLESAPDSALAGRGPVRAAWIAEALTYAHLSDASAPGAFLAGLPPLPRSAEDVRRPPPPPVRRPTPAAVRIPDPTPAPIPRVARPDTPRAVRDTLPARNPHPLPDETTHFAVADGEGNVVSVVQSLGDDFGAGRRAGDLGFFLHADAGRSAAGRGAAPAPADADPEGAREAAAEEGEGDPPRPGAATEGAATEALAPLVVLEGGEPVFALGSPGGPRGLSADVQVLVALLDGGETPRRALESPRVHVDPDPVGSRRARLYLEGAVWGPGDDRRSPGAPWADTLRTLATERRFFVGERDFGPVLQGLDAWFGGVNLLARGPEGWAGWGDPRRDGTARGAGTIPTG